MVLEFMVPDGQVVIRGVLGDWNTFLIATIPSGEYTYIQLLSCTYIVKPCNMTMYYYTIVYQNNAKPCNAYL